MEGGWNRATAGLKAVGKQYLCPFSLLKCLESFFSPSYCTITCILEWKFTLVLAGFSSSLPPTEGGPMSFADSAHHHLSELIQEQPVLPTHSSHLSATVVCFMGSGEGLTGSAWTRTSTGRGWGEKSAVGIGRQVSERNWSLQLLAESGSKIILCQSCIYYLDFCSSFPLKLACQ